jgi:hypothetical protein
LEDEPVAWRYTVLGFIATEDKQRAMQELMSSIQTAEADPAFTGNANDHRRTDLRVDSETKEYEDSYIAELANKAAVELRRLQAEVERLKRYYDNACSAHDRMDAWYLVATRNLDEGESFRFHWKGDELHIDPYRFRSHPQILIACSEQRDWLRAAALGFATPHLRHRLAHSGVQLRYQGPTRTLQRSRRIPTSAWRT